VLLVAVDRNGGGVGRTDNVIRIWRQRENGRLVGLGDRVIDGPERDRDGGRAGANGSITAKPLVIHPISRGTADREEHAQIAIGGSDASDAEFAGVSCGDFGCTGIGGGDSHSRQYSRDRKAGTRVINKDDRPGGKKIIGGVVSAKSGGRSLELHRSDSTWGKWASKRRAEVAVHIIGSAAQVGAGVAGAAPAQPPHDDSGIAFPTEAARREIAGRDKIGHYKIRHGGRRGVAGKVCARDQDMGAHRAVGDIAGQVENGNWVESSGVEHDEFAQADKVLTGRAHAQLDGLRGRVAIDATDDLFDLHEVERGMGGRL